MHPLLISFTPGAILFGRLSGLWSLVGCGTPLAEPRFPSHSPGFMPMMNSSYFVYVRHRIPSCWGTGAGREHSTSVRTRGSSSAAASGVCCTSKTLESYFCPHPGTVGGNFQLHREMAIPY
ncbi:hypothetical protein RRG08_019002 [Elysia crispata]|uniref:Secreted protein n=1 Tax=Elysia crispata TaxID=231223 RepID=A0AAE1A6I6_9GAST|nr:hypothetical protein RRG08_019002 [Elysia crispata]